MQGQIVARRRGGATDGVGRPLGCYPDRLARSHPLSRARPGFGRHCRAHHAGCRGRALARAASVSQREASSSLAQQESSERNLTERTRTVDRLLEFSQTIQGVGKPEQIFTTLSHFLRVELNLAGIVVIASDAEQVPATQVKSSWPETLLCPDKPIHETDMAMCPCFRQNLPREFKNDSARSLRHRFMHDFERGESGVCIPFNLGRKTQVLVHMLLPATESWTESRRQLAQTYCNTACSTLMSLHLLAEAEKQSMTDPLTSLYNRRSMEQLMQREVALAERHGHSLSIVMIDMDSFKEINDHHGHAAGDYVLKAFADVVRFTLRRTDWPAVTVATNS